MKNVAARDFEASVRECTAALRARHPRVSDCRVNVEDRPPHLYERRRYNVRLELVLRGRLEA